MDDTKKVSFIKVCNQQMVYYLKLIVNLNKIVSIIKVSNDIVLIWDLVEKKCVGGTWVHTDPDARKWKNNYPECEFAIWGN